jgi:hypothetical protein
MKKLLLALLPLAALVSLSSFAEPTVISLQVPSGHIDEPISGEEGRIIGNDELTSLWFSCGPDSMNLVSYDTGLTLNFVIEKQECVSLGRKILDASKKGLSKVRLAISWNHAEILN